MVNSLRTLIRRVGKRLIVFFDVTAWILLLMCFIPLWVIDKPMLLTLFHWSAFALALAANAIVVTRLFLPQVDLSEWVKLSKEGSLSAAMVVLAVAILLSSVFLSLILWAKA